MLRFFDVWGGEDGAIEMPPEEEVAGVLVMLKIKKSV